jgi:N-acetylglucosaminyldiphosphoundecaprenol N-acetyl-beta-D-mannosaminyltransferase
METVKKGREKPTIMQIPMSSTDYPQVLTFVAGRLSKKKKFYVVTPNPEILVAAHTDPGLKDILTHADLSIPDGVGLLWANKLLGGVPIKRLPGRKVMQELLFFANERKLRVYFLGSTQKVMEKVLDKTAKEFPTLKAKGNSGPRLSLRATPVTDDEILTQKKVIEEINLFKPHLLFVAFGAPKQEKWIAKHLDQLNIGGAMVVGGSLDSYSGAIRAVPGVLSSFGLEWLWRLLQEPKRLNRIATAVFVFPFLVFAEALRGK